VAVVALWTLHGHFWKFGGNLPIWHLELGLSKISQTTFAPRLRSNFPSLYRELCHVHRGIETGMAPGKAQAQAGSSKGGPWGKAMSPFDLVPAAESLPQTIYRGITAPENRSVVQSIIFFGVRARLPGRINADGIDPGCRCVFLKRLERIRPSPVSCISNGRQLPH
jgi:hypothetical protein